MSDKRRPLTVRLHSVGTNLLLLFFISIVAFVLVVGLVSYRISKQTITTQVANSSLQTIVQANEKLDYIFSDFQTMSDQLQNNTKLMDQLGSMLFFDVPQEQRVAIHREATAALSNMLLSNPYVSGLYILNEEGSLGTSNKNVPPGFAEQPWFKQAAALEGGFLWLGPREKGYLGLGEDGKELFGVARVLKHSVGDSLGVLLIELDTALLTDTLNQVKLASGSVVIRDASGGIAASADGGVPEQLEAFKPAAASGQSTIGSGGSSLLAVYTTSEITGWTLAGFIPERALYAEARDIYRITIICAVTAAVLAILIGLLAARRIGRPITQIRDLMGEGAKGNLTVKSPLRRKDEIGELGDSFNRMIDNISFLVRDANGLTERVYQTAAEIADVSHKTSVSAKEIAAATESIALGADKLAEEAVDGNEITQDTFRQLMNVVDSNEEMASSAAEVSRVSQEGIDYMNRLTSDTRTVEHHALETAGKMERLRTSTGSIESIVDVMEQINRKTNILALNAGIEAARAGAAGKGFMVLANEIRMLASQSQESIQVVAGIVNTIREEINEASASFLQTRQIHAGQVDAVKRANDIFQSVHDAMEDVAERLEHNTLLLQQLKASQSALGESIGNVSAVSQQSSAVSEEVASQSAGQLAVSSHLVELSERLRQLSDELNASLSRFHY
ncbi:MAG TPA: methyl-accepting chemotaxis protein [Paenibacillus sp.]|uniref:methyl-accepting chemotaxis protein n=1 Tax=Paenibacillus sp. TaxID=58172 RepID=UPI0028D89D3C|nr:methyl-accepting chemotaxis protein [Paenibacillus sp.]HUC92463.1 methyl-accepting chemotaxis protein [Paenibacillus sp.]